MISSRALIPTLLSATLTLAALFLPAGALGAVLYDQTTGTPTGLVASETGVPSGLSPQCWAPGPPPFSSDVAQSCWAADDFTIPHGPPWKIRNVHVEGQGGAGDVMDVAFIQDGGGLPALSGGGDIYVEGTGAVQLQPTPGAANDFDIPMGILGRGLVLPPDHYWLGVTAYPVGGSRASPWGWRTQSPQMGYAGGWLNLACGGVQNTSWRPLSDCGQAGPDFRFRLDGELAVEAPDTAAKVQVSGTTAKVTFRGRPGNKLKFKCKLDKGKFKPCTSPKRYRQLSAGKHKVQVEAISQTGTVDPTPAKKTFTV